MSSDDDKPPPAHRRKPARRKPAARKPATRKPKAPPAPPEEIAISEAAADEETAAVFVDEAVAEPAAAPEPEDVSPPETVAEELAEDRAPLPDETGLEDTLSPVDLPPHDPPLEHPLRWTSIAIALATLVLLLFNATALRGWAYELAPGPWTSRIIAASEWWYDTTDTIGLNGPTNLMRGWWQAAQDAEFDAAPADNMRLPTDEAEEPAEDEAAPGFSE